MKKLSTLLLVGIIVVLATGFYAGYSFWQKSSAELQIEQLDKDLEMSKAKILKYENERILQAISAKQTLNNLKATRMEWSEVIKDVRNTLPKAGDWAEIVEVLSYSGSTNREISMSLKTLAGSENPFLDVAKLIASFNKENSNFKDPFVPSIGIGEDKEGSTILNFSLNTKYLKTDVTKALEEKTPPEPVVEKPVVKEAVTVPVETPISKPMPR